MAKYRMNKKLRAIAEEYIALQDRVIHPDGSFDNGGRWYPETTGECCRGIRSPSRAHPYSYMVHCRTATHLACVSKVDENRLRWAVKRLRAEREQI